jgi:hypothetical protein
MRGFGASRTASLFETTDGAATWVEHAIPQFLGDRQGGEASIFIGAVDPTDDSRVYLRSSGSVNGGESRLYVTTDGGMTFSVAKDFQVQGAGLAIVGELLGFALSPDGSRIFVGTKESGLWSASRASMSFSQVNGTVGIQCLASRKTATGTELWACGNEYKGDAGNPGNFIIGRSKDDGATFEARLPTLTTLSGLAQCGSSPQSLACGVTASTATCTCDDYVAFCTNTELTNACSGCGMTPHASSSGGGGSGGGGKGGCTMVVGSEATGFDARRAGAALALALVALAAAGGARRRRR